MFRKIVFIFVVLFILAGIGVSFSFLNQKEEPKSDRINIFLIALEDNGRTGKKIGCGDSLVPLERNIHSTGNVVKATLEELLYIRGSFLGDSGLYNALANSDLSLEKFSMKDKKAIVDLAGQFSIKSVCDTPRVVEQIRETVLQFDEIEEIKVTINGDPLDQIVSGKGE